MIQLTSSLIITITGLAKRQQCTYVLIANPGETDVDVKIPMSIEDVNEVVTSTLIATSSDSFTV